MKRAALTVAVGMLMLWAAVGPAAAQNGTASDASGDAPARIDVTSLHVENGNRWFTMKVDVRDLRQKGVFNFFYERGRREAGDRPHRGSLIIVHRVAGETRARYLGCSSEDCSAEPGERCRRLRATWNSAEDFIRISAPQACIWWLRRNPDRSPPRTGTFEVYATLGDSADDGTDLLVVDRG